MIKAEWTNKDSLSIETTSRNSKAILVIDMPKNCAECKLMFLQWIGQSICNAVDWEERPSWCPLKPLPSFKAVDLNDTRDVVMFCHGWNTCLAEITGEIE